LGRSGALSRLFLTCDMIVDGRISLVRGRVYTSTKNDASFSEDASLCGHLGRGDASVPALHPHHPRPYAARVQVPPGYKTQAVVSDQKQRPVYTVIERTIQDTPL